MNFIDNIRERVFRAPDPRPSGTIRNYLTIPDYQGLQSLQKKEIAAAKEIASKLARLRASGIIDHQAIHAAEQEAQRARELQLYPPTTHDGLELRRKNDILDSQHWPALLAYKISHYLDHDGSEVNTNFAAENVIDTSARWGWFQGFLMEYIIQNPNSASSDITKAMIEQFHAALPSSDGYQLALNYCHNYELLRTNATELLMLGKKSLNNLIAGMGLPKDIPIYDIFVSGCSLCFIIDTKPTDPESIVCDILAEDSGMAFFSIESINGIGPIGSIFLPRRIGGATYNMRKESQTERAMLLQIKRHEDIHSQLQCLIGLENDQYDDNNIFLTEHGDIYVAEIFCDFISGSVQYPKKYYKPFIRLLREGKYNKYEIIILLLNTPLEEWEQRVSEILEKRKPLLRVARAKKKLLKQRNETEKIPTFGFS